MKIKTRELSYEQVLQKPKPENKPPRPPKRIFQALVRLLARKDLKETNFTYTEKRMEEAGEGPWLILMNHSCFLDLEIASAIFYPKSYCIVCTSDGFVGKEWLMRQLGCIPTQKFVSDINLVKDMETALKQNTSLLMYPEASYSFDGCATPLPRHMGRLFKRLDVPVVSVHTEGAFARDPLYNGLRKRKVKVSATVSCLLTREEIREKPVEELDAILDREFTYDSFAWQRDNGVEINEPFRADGLERILFRCAHCKTEGQMEGRGTKLYCHACGKQYEMTPLGQLQAVSGETEFPHIPDWFRWEREQVRQELLDGTYSMDIPVRIGVMVDYKAIYMVGRGRLQHNTDGFRLEGCNGKLSYTQKPLASYSVYSDYYWYEIGDVICIGNKDRLYYCFPESRASVAKIRMAAEELFKIKREEKGRKK